MFSFLHHLRLLFCGAVLQVASALPLLAADVPTLSEQRGLVDQMSLATCMVMADLNPKTNAALALHAADAFDALQQDTTRGAYPGWNTFGPAVRQIASNDFHSVAVRQFLNDSVGLSARLEEALASALEKDARVTAKVTAHIRRLATLSQGMGRDVCLISLDVNSAQATQALGAARAAFETILSDLEEGNAAAGIVVPGDMKYEDQIWMLRGEWDALSQRLQSIDRQVGADQVVSLSEMIGQVYAAIETTLDIYLSTTARGL